MFPSYLILYAFEVNLHSEVALLSFLCEAKRKIKFKKKEKWWENGERRYNLKGGGNVELRTADVLWTRYLFAEGLWMGYLCSGFEWKAVTLVSCPGKLCLDGLMGEEFDVVADASLYRNRAYSFRTHCVLCPSWHLLMCRDYCWFQYATKCTVISQL